MAESAPSTGSEGGAGNPLPRRLGRILGAKIRNGDMIRWIGHAGAMIPVLALGFILVTLIIEALPVIG